MHLITRIGLARLRNSLNSCPRLHPQDLVLAAGDKGVVRTGLNPSPFTQAFTTHPVKLSRRDPRPLFLHCNYLLF